MLADRNKILKILERFNPEKIKLGVLGSHSALDVCDGAKDEGFETHVWCEKGREEPYEKYYRTKYVDGKLIKGCVDHVIIHPRFKDILKDQEFMIKNNILWIPNRSFVVYVGIGEIEKNFLVPIVGSRNLLHIEEREGYQHRPMDYYDLLKKSGVKVAKEVKDPSKIDKLCIVKLQHSKMPLERAFFTCTSYEEYMEKSKRLIKRGIVSKEELKLARIEEYVIGPVMNFDFFYSPVSEKLGEEAIELLGIDWRFESDLDGLVRLPASQQLNLPEEQKEPLYIVVGHNDCTIRESLLRYVYPMAEKFVKATKKHLSPGIIGPFCLQTIINSDMKPIVYDIAVRIGGGTNIHMYKGAPYGNVLWRERMSTGRRVALEIRRAINEWMLEEIVT